MWRSEQAQRCRRCGTFEWEWEDQDPWAADVHTCNGCFKLDEKLQRVQSSPGSHRGQSVRLYRGD